MHKNIDKNSSFWIPSPPYSLDPLEYDYLIHHITTGSVAATLVSKYKVGEYMPTIASSWKNSNNFTKWTFTIRSNLFFEDGTPITPEKVAASIKRIAFVLHRKESKSGIFENILGIEQLKSLNDSLSGLRVYGDQIEMIFNIPMKNLLDLISFGLYGIVHPEDYDKMNGAWKNNKKIRSSGQYKLESWDNEELVLVRREDFIKNYGHPKKFKQIKISWKKNDYNKSDMIFGESFSEGLGSNYSFEGPVKSGIAYVHLFSWNNPKSVFFKKENRIILRDYFYKKLDEQNFRYTRSFFPLAINGVSEINRKTQDAVDVSGNMIDGTVSIPNSSESVNPLVIRFMKIWETFDKQSNKEIKLNINFQKNDFKNILSDLNSNKDEYFYDFSIMRTSILISEPDADIRFMFLSKEGIRLPDPDGSIHKMLDEKEIDIQKINQKLWDDAIIWPVLNYASGLWAEKDIDFSLLNLNLPPIDFSWIGAK